MDIIILSEVQLVGAGSPGAGARPPQPGGALSPGRLHRQFQPAALRTALEAGGAEPVTS